MTETRYEAALAEARAILDEDLGTLPANLAKLLRAGFKTGPTAPYVAAWCAENPEATARIVGAVAMVAATKSLVGQG